MVPLNEPIAIIGSGCRFPGESTSPSKLWSLLKQPRDVLSKVDRFNVDSWYHEDGHHHGTSNVRHSYLLSEDGRAFDPQFFSISGSEADSIDPQQRHLMEVVYEGLESAGLTIEELQGSNTGVYVGVMCDDYAQIIYQDAQAIPKYAATGSARSIMSNRISYFFDWNGPSMTIDTACSSSLVAMHQGVQLLRSGQSRVAVAAGTNLIFGPSMYIAESNVNMLSATGRSRMWSADADGYARGEGVAAVIMKKLSDAIADGDNIECIVRETGLNQDGRTPGITMPSAAAQASLIRTTYAAAGLDIRKKEDRCQYFEAHGTGTKAGDPQEAGAIYKAFFEETGVTDPEDILYVGSIKTIIGHTEGTAGLAGVLKASLAVQNKVIPPNLHFTSLNPDIEPFYDHLKIPTSAQNWPELAPGAPRRVSVNSFGFGGANAHAIIESYEPSTKSVVPVKRATDAAVVTPFPFSATSERSLAANITTYVEYLKAYPEISLRDLSWTLSRKSALTFRTSVAASSIESLISKLEVRLEEKKSNTTPIGVRALKQDRLIMGVFTGQGAQWSQMGRDLITSSSFASKIIDDLEKSLAELPAADRPAWSLRKEMMAPAKESRIGEGALSQPLCTAIQLVLVELLKTAGITFDVVVGHSSGEIAAAYTAGFFSARDALRIAYYRGLYAKLAQGENGVKGAMLAAGTSMEDAQELCDLPVFEGRMKVAASNSSSSVTLSGDEDAIEEAVTIFEDEQKFARKLKVDTAYHSHHMQPCSGPYIQALNRCKIEIKKPSESVRWYSSVLGGQLVDSSLAEDLKSVYWKDNMLKPVLFSQAIEAAINAAGAPSLAIEVGPHPALKGPAISTIEEVGGSAVPYTGVLSRGKNDVESFAAALGYYGEYYAPASINYKAYDALFNGEPAPVLLKGLPSYTWDHERSYWCEARESRLARYKEDAPHELLGVRTGDSPEGEYRWRNFLKPTESPWLRGHAIQGQPLFPAAGFAVMAIEAAKVLAKADEITLIELQDLDIHRGMAFNDEVAGVETVFSLTNVQEVGEDKKTITANFCIDASMNKDTGVLQSMANGKIILTLGEPSIQALPKRSSPPVNLRHVDVDHFYSSLATLGYNYSEMFRGIVSLKRTTDAASGVINIPAIEGAPSPWSIHPSTLDVACQSIFAALGSPGDGRLYTLQVPTIIRKIVVNPYACPTGAGLGVDVPFDSTLAQSLSGGSCGDVDIYDETGSYTIVQVEGFNVMPLAAPAAADDRRIFADTIWARADPDLEVGYKKWEQDETEVEGSLLVERTCLFYLKNLIDTITPEELEKCDAHRTRFMEWANYEIDLCKSGKHAIAPTEWLNDTHQYITGQIEEQSKIHEDLKIMSFVGERLIGFVRGQISLLEEFLENDMLEHFYRDTYGFPEYNAYLGGFMKQLSHRFPQMDIFEIGAGTGSTTLSALKGVGPNYASYTYTDISAGFFLEAGEIFKDHKEKFVYKVFNAENDPVEQGFAEHTYDVVIASNVLHATKNMDETLKNARKLLKPGGYVVVLEITDPTPMRSSFIFGTIAGWWAGPLAGRDGRYMTPLLTQKKWDSLFRETGFAGIETATPESGLFMVPFSIMAAQAVDTQMKLIREPLAPVADAKSPTASLLILGGKHLPTAKLGNAISTLVTPYYKDITFVESLEALLADMSVLEGQPTILSLAELDGPTFGPFTPEKLKAMQELFEKSRNVLWLLQGARGEQPYSNMMIGTARCLVAELPILRLQFLNIDLKEKFDPRFVAENLLRLQISDAWRNSITLYKPLWSLEREIYLIDGHVEVPRYQPNHVQNARYNSNRRIIRRNVSLEDTTVKVTAGQFSYDIQEHTALTGPVEIEDGELVTVDVKNSVLSAVKVKSVGFVFLVLGVNTETKQRVIALSKTNRSTVTVPKSWIVDISVPTEHEHEFLLAVANAFVAANILGKGEGSILVNDPTPSLARSIARQAKSSGATVAFATTSYQFEKYPQLHPSTPDRLLKLAIPKGVSTFVDLSAATEPNSVGARIQTHLPATCKVKTGTAYFKPTSSTRSNLSEDVGATALKDAFFHALMDFKAGVSSSEAQIIPAGSIAGQPLSHSSIRIVDWTADKQVPVKVVPMEDEVKFRGDKTYFLVGLTGELGLSLCQWMADRGAKYFAITSRNPQIDKEWLGLMAAKGATVKAFAMDITKREALHKVYDEMKATMPPVAGVANGAMVLIDGMFNSISHEDFQKTLTPKVEGSIYLNELFQENNLDFFMFFSSLASITGNDGQSPYAAANSFMTGLALQRRSKGLAGSVMHLAGIFGIGYITRTNRNILERLGNMGYANMSEWDFHQFFAEAVVAGLPHSGLSPELGCGLRETDPDTPSPPAWINIPRFAHYRKAKVQALTAEGGDKSAASVRSKLKDMTSEEGVYQLLLDGLLATLYRQLRMPPEDNGITPETTIVELGVDSLVAVDMRHWFTSELDLDMPVLKILGGATVGDLVQDAVDRLSRELIPNVKADGAAEDAKATTTAVAATKFEAPKGAAPMIMEPMPKPAVVQPFKERETDERSEDSAEVIGTGSSSPKSSQDSAIDVGSSLGTSISDVQKEDKSADLPALTFERAVRMSYGATRFWFLRQYLQDPTTFNLTFRMSFNGALREHDLEQAVEALGNRHEAFRTVFFADPARLNEPTQGVLAKTTLRLEKKKISGVQDAIAETEKVIRHPFNLERGEALRIVLLSTSPTSHYIVFGFHHIIMDGISFRVLINDLNNLYDKKTLSPVSMQFTDFAVRQRREVEQGKMKNEIKYWNNEFPDFPEPLPLFPVAEVNSRLVLKEYEFEEVEISLDKETINAVKAAAKSLKATNFHFFLATLKIFLFKFLDISDVCIGMADANRTDSTMEGTVGFILNVLALRFKALPNETFAAAITQARTRSYAALANSRLPFDVLLETLDIPRSPTHSPLFQVFMDYRQLALQGPKVLGAQSDGIASVGRTGYDMVLDVHDAGSEVKVIFRMQKYLYSQASTKILVDSYVRLLKQFAAAPNNPTSKAQLFAPADIEKAKTLGRGPQISAPWPDTAVHRVEEVAAANGSSLALQDGVKPDLTYSEMSKRVDTIASALLKAGVNPQSTVAVFQEPSSDWICSLLAIWKVGGVYVPLDIANTLPRLAMIVEDCKPTIIISDESTNGNVDALKSKSASIVNVSILGPTASDKVANKASGASAAVTLYTSGSTGTPKGISLSHSSILNEIQGFVEQYNIGKEKVLQQSAYTFDHSIEQILTALSTGGSLYVAPRALRGNALELTKVIVSEKITYTKATPSEYSSWLQHGSDNLSRATSWKLAFSGGEALHKKLALEFRALQKPDLKLFNSYGPAEITTACSKTEVPYLSANFSSDEIVSCGKSLPNYSMYIVDRNLNPVPCGVTGEILIGGAGSAIGYVNNVQLTKAKFLPDTLTPKASGTIYRSGDLGRLSADGSLQFKGRTDGDSQVKLRGIRIELEDIESTIVQTSAGILSRAAVSLRGKSQFFVAHVQFSSADEPSDKDSFLQDLLSRLPLPQYMCPAILIPLDEIPLNSHAKINRVAVNELPLPRDARPSKSDAPLTKTEERLKAIWEKAVSDDLLASISIISDTDFFHVGGNSLLLVQLQALIREEFHATVPMLDLFENTTLSQMSTRIDNANSVASIDWKSEVSIPADFARSLPAITTKSSSASSSSSDDDFGLVALLTGPTGFLGSNILKGLVANPRISKIHCVGVRPDASSTTRTLPITSPKITIHTGDLSVPQLSLSDKAFAELSSEVDVIVHSGANRAFWDYYQQLKGSNFYSTKELVKLAAPRKIPFHFISSGGVLDLPGQKKGDLSVSRITPPVDGSKGYLATKWASEVYLENARLSLGLPTYIHRVTPPASTASKTISPEMLEDFSQIASKLQKLPSTNNWDGQFDLIAVSPLVAQIVSTAIDSPSVDGSETKKKGTSFIHHPADVTMRMKDILRYLDEHEGRDRFEYMAPHKWVGLAKKMGIRYHFATQDFKISGAEGDMLQLKR